MQTKFKPIESTTHSGFYHIPDIDNYIINREGDVINIITNQYLKKPPKNSARFQRTLLLSTGKRKTVFNYLVLREAIYGPNPVICCYDIEKKALYESTDITHLSYRIGKYSKNKITSVNINDFLRNNKSEQHEWVKRFKFLVWYKEDKGESLAKILDLYNVKNNAAKAYKHKPTEGHSFYWVLSNDQWVILYNIHTAYSGLKFKLNYLEIDKYLKNKKQE